MINSIQGFVDYFASVRRRTLNYARVVPDDHIHWSPQKGEFTCAVILRHIAAGEKMFVGVVTQGKMKLTRMNSIAHTALQPIYSLESRTGL